jgi:hypothetical protein
MSLVKTYLQDIRANYPSNLDRDELRQTQTGLVTAVLAMTNSASSIVSPDLIAQAETSQGRNLDVPVMTKGNITIKNVRSCTIGGDQSESDLVRVVWKTVVADILMVPSQYEKNQIKYQFDLNKKIKETVEAFLVEIENDLDTAFDANKSQVYGSSIVGTKYPLVGSAIRVAPANLDFFFNDLEAINFADDFNDPTIRVIANHTVMPTVTKYINQGSGNNQNLQFQFAGKNFTFSNRISNGAGVLATGYFMPDGSVGMLTRVDVDARLGHKASDGTEWMEETLPGLPFPVGIQYKSKCDDKSALEVAGLAHLTATMVEHWQISFDFAIITPYNSDLATKPNSIRKFEFIP